MSNKNGLPKGEYIAVTPDMAQAWLDKQARNRKTSAKRVALYSGMMKRGDWYPTSAGIAIDEFDQLIDGQHRLLAVIDSQTTIPMLVVKGVAHKAQLVLDQSLKRQGHDQIAIQEGWDVKPIHIAVAKQIIYSISAGGSVIDGIIGDLLLMDDFYKQHHKAIEFAVHEFFQFTPIKGVTVAPVIAPVARAFYTQDRERLCRFARVLATGLADQKGDGPAAVFRNWLLRGATQVRAKAERRLIYNKSEIALDAFVKGESIQRLGSMTIDRELFPIPGENIRVIRDGKAMRKTADKSGRLKVVKKKGAA